MHRLVADDAVALKECFYKLRPSDPDGGAGRTRILALAANGRQA